jgi:hypothetical protein
MLDLAISIDTNFSGTDIIETNHGGVFEAPEWPRDCEFQLVAYRPSDKSCEVISATALAEDIGHAINALQMSDTFDGAQSEWYWRLKQYAAGTAPMETAT